MKRSIKKTTAILTAVLLLLLAVMPAASFAYEGDYKTGIYRINDFVGVMTDDQLDELDDYIYTLIDEYKLDLPIAVMNSETLSGNTMNDYGEWFFEHNDYGYGTEATGLLLLIVPDKGKVKCLGFGDAYWGFTEMQKKALADSVEKNLSADMYSVLKSYIDTAVSVYGTEDEETAGEGDASQTQTDTAASASNMPAWYPEDVSAFTDFHNVNAPRVIDTADIFTDAEEMEMTRKAESLVEKYGYDFVIFTDVSSYGLGRDVYAADFYQFNGYGLGDDYSGSILFICMEEGNRGWWSAARGSAREFFTQLSINWIDDQLEPYMVDGNYGEGVIDYIDNLAQFYALPDWYPEDPSSFTRFHGNGHKVVDNIGALTDEELGILEAKAQSICSTYDTDVLIIMDNVYRLSSEELGQAYALYNGYGVGDDYDCSIMAINEAHNINYNCSFTGEREYFSYDSRDRLNEWISFCSYEHNYFKSASVYLNKLEKMYKKGRVPKQLHPVFPMVLGLIIGLIAAAICTAILKSRMTSVYFAKGAKEYVVSQSFAVTYANDIFKNTDKKYTYRPKDDDSSSSGGGSSYSSSYSSSGGASFSGGGRSF